MGELSGDIVIQELVALLLVVEQSPFLCLQQVVSQLVAQQGVSNSISSGGKQKRPRGIHNGDRADMVGPLLP